MTFLQITHKAGASQSGIARLLLATCDFAHDQGRDPGGLLDNAAALRAIARCPHYTGNAKVRAWFERAGYRADAVA